jgi:hypothetical protein
MWAEQSLDLLPGFSWEGRREGIPRGAVQVEGGHVCGECGKGVDGSVID